MHNNSLVHDLRIARGQIWNIEEVSRRFPLKIADAPWNQKGKPAQSEWIDKYIYEGYRKYGNSFLAHLKGRFATVYFDDSRNILFLARDWIGELPMHVLATAEGFFVANTIGAIKDATPSIYSYAYVRSFRQAYCQEIDLTDADPTCVSVTMRPMETKLYSDFGALVEHASVEIDYDLSASVLAHFRSLLFNSVQKRAQSTVKLQAVLLSGGLDSFTVALAMKVLGIPFEAYTLCVGNGGEDVIMAADFARRFDIKHHLIQVSTDEVVAAFEDGIVAGECYPIYNLYCAVGMVLMARGLAAMDVRSAFCGEGVNEAVGDYKSWEVNDAISGGTVTLQRINNERLQQVEERQAMVWGHPHDKGKYNKQLGTGLAKHAGSRMVKPFLHTGLTLECPYYDSQLMARMVAIPPDILNSIGGKPGLVFATFEQDLKKLGIGKELIEACKKVRFQDASEGGKGGITEALLAAGCNQQKAIEIFNRKFGANLDPVLDGKRLALTRP